MELIDNYVLSKLSKEKKFDVIFGTMVVSEKNPGWVWRTDGVYNRQSYSNQELDRVFERIDQATSKSTVLKLLEKVEHEIEKDFAVTVLFAYKTYNFGVSNKVEVVDCDDQYLVNFEEPVNLFV